MSNENPKELRVKFEQLIVNCSNHYNALYSNKTKTSNVYNKKKEYIIKIMQIMEILLYEMLDNNLQEDCIQKLSPEDQQLLNNNFEILKKIYDYFANNDVTVKPDNIAFQEIKESVKKYELSISPYANWMDNQMFAASYGLPLSTGTLMIGCALVILASTLSMGLPILVASAVVLVASVYALMDCVDNDLPIALDNYYVEGLQHFSIENDFHIDSPEEVKKLTKTTEQEVNSLSPRLN